jgi:biopolymer transport protein ExbD
MSFSPREARNIIRKEVHRVPEGEEVRHLNITAMMDMMTILLVTFIFQASVTTEINAGEVELPNSVSDEPMPEARSTVVITQTGIVVEGKTIAAVRDGDVDASEKEGGALGVKIPALTNFLSNLRGIEEQRLKERGKTAPAVPELMILADRHTPYRLLLQVMFSAKQKEAGYKRFRLVVQKHHPVGPRR